MVRKKNSQRTVRVFSDCYLNRACWGKYKKHKNDIKIETKRSSGLKVVRSQKLDLRQK